MITERYTRLIDPLFNTSKCIKSDYNSLKCLAIAIPIKGWVRRRAYFFSRARMVRSREERRLEDRRFGDFLFGEDFFLFGDDFFLFGEDFRFGDFDFLR